MNILDIIILICMFPILINGYKKGLVNQMVSTISLIAGVWAAYVSGSTVGEWIMPMMEGNCENPENMAYLGGFAITLTVVCAACLLIGRLLEKVLLVIIPKSINRILGLFLSVANGAVLTCTLFLIFRILNRIYYFTDFKEAVFSESQLLPYIEDLTSTIFPDILKVFG